MVNLRNHKSTTNTLYILHKGVIQYSGYRDGRADGGLELVLVLSLDHSLLHQRKLTSQYSSFFLHFTLKNTLLI